MASCPPINQGTFISNRVQTAADTPGGADGEMMTEEMPEDDMSKGQWRKA